MSDNELDELLYQAEETLGIRITQQQNNAEEVYTDDDITEMFDNVDLTVTTPDVEMPPEVDDEQLHVEFQQANTEREELQTITMPDGSVRIPYIPPIYDENTVVIEDTPELDIETPVIAHQEDMPETAEAQFFREEQSQETEYATNSLSFFERESTSRFKGADWYNVVQQQVILLAGLGGIGSWTSLLLSRMRPKAMFLYDADRVEMANMSGQLFGLREIGMSKTSACLSLASNLSDYRDVFCKDEFFTNESEAGDIMICGFDSMQARRTFFESWVNHLSTKKTPEELQYCLFIDGRMAAESIQVFAFTGDDKRAIQQYKDEWLFDDAEADATVCSYKQTTFCAAMIGSIITNLFVNFCTNLGGPNIPRDLPFMTSYEADRMYFKVEA